MLGKYIANNITNGQSLETAPLKLEWCSPSLLLLIVLFNVLSSAIRLKKEIKCMQAGKDDAGSTCLKMI